ncbi:MAG: hypothetical protein N3F09_06340 [Bacteroidia bacterium]|nr:hypothetical protein [Bacteroidia bacterium]
MFKGYYWLLFLFLISCKRDKHKAPEVFYVKPDPVLLTTQAGQGSAHHKITDIWFYSDGKFRGIYPVGNPIPVIKSSEKQRLDFFAGILNSGSSQSRISWDLYAPIRLDTSASPLQTLNIPLSFTYKNSVVFAWMEDFEMPGFSLIKSSVADTNFKVHQNNSHVFEGNRSIEFGLAGNKQLAQFESASSYTFPATSQNIFLELSYKCNCEFEVGIQSLAQYFPVRFITPKEHWNKIYLFLTEAIRADAFNNEKKIIIKLRRDSEIPEQKVWIDNIKLVYLP